jgi:hypothetical protein
MQYGLSLPQIPLTVLHIQYIDAVKIKHDKSRTFERVNSLKGKMHGEGANRLQTAMPFDKIKSSFRFTFKNRGNYLALKKLFAFKKWTDYIRVCFIKKSKRDERYNLS